MRCRRSPARSMAAMSSPRPLRTSRAASGSSSLAEPSILADCLTWSGPGRTSDPGRLGSSAIYVDTFGNVKLSALADDLLAALPGLRLGESLVIRVADGARPEVRALWARTFGDVPEGCSAR